MPVRIGARNSPLARVQADHVAGLLAAVGAESTLVGITTTGDVDRRHLTEIGGTGVFAGALRDALRTGEIDLAVHSLKDLPTIPAVGLTLAAVPVREDARDVLIGRRLEDLAGARIGTGAPRRALQLEAFARVRGWTTDIVPVRGNVDTRLGLVRDGQLDGVVLAAAGLRRLGHLDLEIPDNCDTEVAGLPAQVLSAAVMLPAPGQGALGLEISSRLRTDVQALIERLDDPVTHAETVVERGFLAALEAGCTAPVGARAVVKLVRGTSLDLTLDAVIGRTLLSNLSEPTKSGPPIRIRRSGTTKDPGRFGADAAGKVLAELRAHNALARTGEAEQENAR